MPTHPTTHKPAEAVHQIDEPQAEALRLAAELVEPIDGFQEPTMLEAAAAAELRRQHARIVELETEKVLNDSKQRFAIAEALGLGNANYAWSYLHDQIKSLLTCEEDLIALRTQAAAQQAVQGMDMVNCKSGNWLTVVYRDIRPGDEARTIGEHPKVSALSWSHALNERDAALAAQAKQRGE